MVVVCVLALSVGGGVVVVVDESSIGPPALAKFTITSLASRNSACNPIIVSALERRMTFKRTLMAATGRGMDDDDDDDDVEPTTMPLPPPAPPPWMLPPLPADPDLERCRHRSDITGCSSSSRCCCCFC